MAAFEDRTIGLLEALVGQQRDLVARVNAAERELGELTSVLDDYKQKQENLEKLRGAK